MDWTGPPLEHEAFHLGVIGELARQLWGKATVVGARRGELKRENGSVRSEAVKVNQFPQVNHGKGPVCAEGLGGRGPSGDTSQ